MSNGYRSYSADGTYWTVRKMGKTFWVVRIDPSGMGYRPVEWWGGYQRAGAAGGAAAQLAYNQAIGDARERIRDSLHDALDGIGLGASVPAAPIAPSKVPYESIENDWEDE